MASRCSKHMACPLQILIAELLDGACRLWPHAQRCGRQWTSQLAVTTLRRAWVWAELAQSTGVQLLLE